MASSTVGTRPGRTRGRTDWGGSVGRDPLATMGRSQLGGCDGAAVVVMEHLW